MARIIGETEISVNKGSLYDGVCIIVLGEISYGLTFVGPFVNFAAARDYGSATYTDNHVWTIEQLISADQNHMAEIITEIKKASKGGPQDV